MRTATTMPEVENGFAFAVVTEVVVELSVSSKLADLELLLLLYLLLLVGEDAAEDGCCSFLGDMEGLDLPGDVARTRDTD